MVKMENQKRWVQVGIVSFGPIGCAPPGKYSNFQYPKNNNIQITTPVLTIIAIGFAMQQMKT
jgi:hypothetical protein